MSKTKTPETPEMPKPPNVEIAVKNFGPIAEATIDLRPLTVFVGPSNTGKTYFSTLIYVLDGVFTGHSKFPGHFKRLGIHGFKDLVDRNWNKIRPILKKLNISNQSIKFSDLPPEIRASLESDLKNPESIVNELKRCFDLNSITELIRLKNGQRSEMNISLEVKRENQRLWNFKIAGCESNLAARGSVNEDLMIYDKDSLISHSHKELDIDDLFFWAAIELDRHREKRFYLPAARSGIMQSHRVITSSLVERATRGGLTPLEIPTFSGVVADFMQQLILYEESEVPDNRMKPLAEAIESDVLAGQILMKPTPSGYPEFLYRPSAMGEEVRLTRAASMVSELAPVVLFLRGGIRPGDTLIIEEPEAHLHPGAQTEIALTLAGLVRAGVRVIVTTHSDWLLKEIANLIRIGDLKRKGVPQVKKMESIHWLLPEEVGTWWFQEDGIVKQIPFDPTEGIEPKDYEDVADKLYDRSVNLQDLLEKVNKE
ncbi:MAG: AAA family ATPase [Candidatus Poribacteria bacterium]|nr:AAA family ATPase [Candidatus Poribacteria bacterium]